MREIAALQRPPAAAADTIVNKWASVLNRLGHGREARDGLYDAVMDGG
jgi:hypothetical protein